MKKIPNNKNDKDFKKLVARNWLICIGSLLLILFFYYVFPLILPLFSGE